MSLAQALAIEAANGRGPAPATSEPEDPHAVIVAETERVHGRALRCDTKRWGTWVFRRPTPAECALYAEMLFADSGKNTAKSQIWLLTTIVVHPHPSAWELLLKDYPLCPLTIARKLAHFIGMTDEEEGKD